MRVALVGADLEENLGLGMIASAAEAAGHSVRVVPYDDPSQRHRAVSDILAQRPDVVGLGMQFQHRAYDFLDLARRLRDLGFSGHITAGGQFPTMAYREVLARNSAVDSVVLYEGEATFVELLGALSRGDDPSSVRGLALRGGDEPIRNESRPLGDLDRLPFPKRYRPHTRHMGVPFIPIMGSRGCWGSCTYCSITTFYRDARAHGGGKTLRHRSAENVATEMALLWHSAGGPSVFCFHDDNFLLPRPADSLARVREIRSRLDDYGVGKIGIIGKCRPDCVNEELLRELRALGVLRLYIGVENASQHGADDLGRKTQNRHVGQALDAADAAGIFTCYNLLLFTPEATLADVKENVAFIRTHATHPVNFCRAEPYYGTPLHRSLQARDAVSGSFLGFDYRIGDDRAELLFRICAAAFRERNFAPEGVGNRYMGVGYTAKLIEHFYDDPRGIGASLRRRATELTKAIALETADMLEEAIAIAESVDLADHDRIERETAVLGLKIAGLDAVRLSQIDELHSDMMQFVRDAESPLRRRILPPRLAQLAQTMALASAFGVWAMGCGAKMQVADPVPPDTGFRDGTVSDPVPFDSGVDSGDVTVVDAVPPDMGLDTIPVDPPPPDVGVDVMDAGDGADVPMDVPVVDPPPPDTGAVDSSHVGSRDTAPSAERRLRLIDQWTDTSPKRAARSDDLALSQPPTAALRGKRDGDAIVVRIVGAPGAIGTRWQGDGVIEGEGAEVTWRPSGPNDSIRVAIRARGGVAVVALRACDLAPARATI